MTSGKASRKAKQNPTTPPKRTPTKSGGRSASPKVLAIGGAVVLAIVVAIVLGVVLAGGSSTSIDDLPETGSLETNLSGATEVDELYAGIPQKALVLGKPDAPVTMVEWLDLQCPACRAFETEAFPEIVEKWVRTGKLRVEMKPWAFIGPDSVSGRDATIAASNQDRAFNYAALLYGNQGAENAGWLDDEMMARTAAAIPGVIVAQVMDEKESSEVVKRGEAVDEEALKVGVTSTPTLFVGKTGEKGAQIELTSLTDPTPVNEAIEEILAGG